MYVGHWVLLLLNSCFSETDWRLVCIHTQWPVASALWFKRSSKSERGTGLCHLFFHGMTTHQQPTTPPNQPTNHHRTLCFTHASLMRNASTHDPPPSLGGSVSPGTDIGIFQLQLGHHSTAFTFQDHQTHLEIRPMFTRWAQMSPVENIGTPQKKQPRVFRGLLNITPSETHIYGPFL